jgi:integrase/recombinase XerD
MEQNKALFEAQIQNNLHLTPLVEQYEVKRWLQGKNEGTKCTYCSALKAFIEFTKHSPKEIIDEAEEDRNKSVRERGEPEYQVRAFGEWLTTEYPQKGRGRGKRKAAGKKGVSKSIAYCYANAIKGFYRANGFPLDVEIQKAPPKKENFKLALRAPDIKRLVDSSSNLRDRAIILTLFMSGMSISELCGLTYGDIANGLQNNEEPLNLHLIRKKEQVEYDTFIGTDAIEAVKAYLDQRKRKGEILKIDSPLFILQFTTKPKSSKFRKIYPSLVETFLRTTALKAGLLTQEQLDAADLSPCRPHALRTAFLSILKMNGVNNTLVEYLAGHTIPPTEKAYLRLTTDELRKIYKQHEKHLSITQMIDSEKIDELEQKAKALEQNSQNNQGIITALLENGKNKDQQVNNMATLLSQVQESLNRINDEMNFHRLEDVARFVAAKAPTREEMTNFLSKRQISQNIFQRSELNCIAFSPETNTWTYSPENDLANLLTA